MAAFDFWRLPVLQEKVSEDPSSAIADVASVPGPCDRVVSPEARVSSPHAARQPPRGRQRLPRWVRVAEVAEAPCELAGLQLAEVVAARVPGCPVSLASLAAYILSLRFCEESSGVEAGTVAAEQLWKRFRDEFRPLELHRGLSARSCASDSFLEGEESLAGSSTSGSSGARIGWRALYPEHFPSPEVSLVCGQLRSVPPLPNPFTVLTDVPSLVEHILADIPLEQRDTKQFRPPERVEGFPGLYRGLGGLLSPLTPREAAQNAVAAALLTRLCGNTLSALSRRVIEAMDVVSHSSEEIAFSEACSMVKEADAAVIEAKAEEAAALSALRKYEAEGEADLAAARDLECRRNWKAAVVKQMLGNQAESQRLRGVAEAAFVASEARGPAKRWQSRWRSILPAEAAGKPALGVRLAPTSPMLYSMKEFVEAMSHGFMDRTTGSYVPKHMLEVAFVRHAADTLLLCSRSDEKSEEYTHHLAPATVTACFLDLDSGCASSDIRTVRPHHGQLIRVQGQTFSFGVLYTSTLRAGAGFIGVGCHPLTTSTPWNPIEYGDVLWSQEAFTSFVILPTIAALSTVVWDPDLPIGILPPLPRGTEDEVEEFAPIGSGSLALLQAALFEDVKMWPVAMPDLARSRWDLVLRALRHALQASSRDNRSNLTSGSPEETEAAIVLEAQLDALRDEVLPQCLRGLAKVPDDVGGGDRLGCRGIADRMKRMEMSALTQIPLQTAQRFQSLLAELVELWAGFELEAGTELP